MADIYRLIIAAMHQQHRSGSNPRDIINWLDLSKAIEPLLNIWGEIFVLDGANIAEAVDNGPRVISLS